MTEEMRDEEQDKREGETEEETLLRQIREDFTYCKNYWREIHEEYKTDLQFVAGDPWAADDRAEREANHRPVVSPDELNQYLNQAINNLRQNKRAIKVNPKGDGATDEDAQRRASIIRGFEYDSNAQAAYTGAFEGILNGGLGALRLVNAYVASGSQDQEPRIRRIPNPLTVLWDPDAREADRSDQNICFVTDMLRTSTFARRYPQAKKRSFTVADQNIAPEWFHGDNIVIAEYWKREAISSEKGRETYRVKQYITNGVEILEENEWAGSWIPIIFFGGKELYVTEGNATKLKLISMVRLARTPQRMLAYLASQMAEEAGMTPRAPLFLYAGQEEADEDALKYLNRRPVAYVKITPTVDAASGQLLPMPERPQFQPNFAAYEQAMEYWRRSIQAAMGINPLPTAAQRQNEKSGIALGKIQQQEAVGSFHFTDNFDRGLENLGRQLNEQVTELLDTPRQVGIRNPDDSHALLHVSTKEHGVPDGAEEKDVLFTDRGEFGVTISTGPSYQSEREEGSAFVDLIVQNIESLPIDPQSKAKILAKGVKLKNLGPIGDEIAEILDPETEEHPIPPQAAAQLQQLQQQLKAVDALAAQLQKEKEGRVLELESKERIAQMHEETQRLGFQVQRDIAEITTKAQDQRERLKLDASLDEALHVAAHEHAQQKDQQTHEFDLQQQQGEQASALAAQNAAQEAVAQPAPATQV